LPGYLRVRGKPPISTSTSVTFPVRIVAHPVAKGTVEFTARTRCLVTHYTAHTARMVEQPIGVRTPMAMTAIAKLICDGIGTTQFLFFAVKNDFIKRTVTWKFLADYPRGILIVNDLTNRPHFLEIIAS
jgi:hypothetical protein